MKHVRLFVRGLVVVTLVAAVVAGGALVYLRYVAQPRTDGELRLAGLTAPVRVVRDAQGIPYLFADNLPDLIRAQGFVTAQHRLFQLEAYRAIAHGRLAEAIGEAGLKSDREVRLIGLARNARRHTALLSPAARDFLAWYAEGVTAYVRDHAAEHPVELGLAGFAPSPWTTEDLVTLLHYVNYSHAANLRSEITAQLLIEKLGPERAAGLMPVNVNPDRSAGERVRAAGAAPQRIGLSPTDLALSLEPGIFDVGSNNWAVAGARTASGGAIVANDPHLDARVLPGIWHPIGLHAPGLQAVGAALPGLPGLIVGRTRDVAFGVTNAYGDSQDLFVETVDPADPTRYRDGDRFVPFGRITETIRVKDAAAPGGFREEALTVLTTTRGPVITGHPSASGAKAVLSLRTVAAEVPGGPLGIETMLFARDAAAFDRAVQQMDVMYFNYVFADTSGTVAHRATGRVPVRRSGHGVHPKPAADDWTGMIPADEMPGVAGPARGFAGTANHDTRPDGYRYHYSSYFSPPSRWETIRARLSADRKFTVADNLALQKDVRNPHAPTVVPLVVAALRAGGRHGDLADVLAGWTFEERADLVAPTVYHTLFKHLVQATFTDELGPALAERYLSNWYMWRSRFDEILQDPQAPWFDDVTTPRREGRDDIIRRAADRARAELTAALGTDPAQWQWGKVHRLTFSHPLRRSGPGRDLVGGGTHASDGSGETVQRANWAFGKDFDVTSYASMRFVADLADGEKVTAVVPGGVSERSLSPHQRDQLQVWLSGDLTPWWFDPEAIEAHAVRRALLRP